VQNGSLWAGELEEQADKSPEQERSGCSPSSRPKASGESLAQPALEERRSKSATCNHSSDQEVFKRNALASAAALLLLPTFILSKPSSYWMVPPRLREGLCFHWLSHMPIMSRHTLTDTPMSLMSLCIS